MESAASEGRIDVEMREVGQIELYEIAVDADPKNTRWIMHGAKGLYFIGKFDGNVFTPESGPHALNSGNCFYASQTFNHLPATDGRRGIRPSSAFSTARCRRRRRRFHRHRCMRAAAWSFACHHQFARVPCCCLRLLHARGDARTACGVVQWRVSALRKRPSRICKLTRVEACSRGNKFACDDRIL